VLPSRSLLYRIFFLLPVILSLFLGIASCGTKAAAFTPLTVLSIVGGNVLIQKTGSSNWSAGKEGTTLQAGDKIKTDTAATATVTFFDGSTIDLNGGTEISLDELLSKSSTTPKTIKIGQTIGETSSTIVKLVDAASRYEIDTQSGVAAVRGSKMAVLVSTDGTTQVYNIEGRISFTGQGQEVMIPVGSVSTAKPGQVPSTPQPGTPPTFGGSNATSISSTSGWQQSGLYLNAGDKFYVDYRGGSWTVDYTKFPYVGPSGYSSDIDKTIDHGSNAKIDTSVPYGYLLGTVGNGKETPIGNYSGPFTADANGYLSLRINDTDSTLGDNDGAITVNLRVASLESTNQTTMTATNTTSTPATMPSSISIITTSSAILAVGSTTTATSSTTSTASAPTSVATKYQNTTYGYAIQILPEWTVHNADASNVFIDSSGQLANIEILSTTQSGSNLDVFLNYCVSTFKQRDPDYAEQSRTKITVSGDLPAYYINLTYSKAGVALQGLMLVTVKDNYGYCLIGETPSTQWGNYGSNLASIINSLTVNY